MRIAGLVVLLLLGFHIQLEAGGIVDDFTQPMREGRQALRGEWTFENGQAHCVSDPELYKKFKDHGPILRWPTALREGTLSFELMPKDCQRVVITFNNEDGHVLRMMLSDKSRIFGWNGPSKTTKPTNILSASIPTTAELNGKWVKVHLVIQGDRGVLTISDITAELQHAALAREKGEFTISFAGGELSVRAVSWQKTK